MSVSRITGNGYSRLFSIPHRASKRNGTIDTQIWQEYKNDVAAKSATGIGVPDPVAHKRPSSMSALFSCPTFGWGTSPDSSAGGVGSRKAHRSTGRYANPHRPPPGESDVKTKSSNSKLSRAGKVLGILPTRDGRQCLVVMQALHAGRNDPIVTTIRPASEVPAKHRAKVRRWMRELDLMPAAVA